MYFSIEDKFAGRHRNQRTSRPSTPRREIPCDTFFRVRQCTIFSIPLVANARTTEWKSTVVWSTTWLWALRSLTPVSPIPTQPLPPQLSHMVKGSDRPPCPCPCPKGQTRGATLQHYDESRPVRRWTYICRGVAHAMWPIGENSAGLDRRSSNPTVANLISCPRSY